MESTAKTDQTGQMPRLIWAFAGHTGHSPEITEKIWTPNLIAVLILNFEPHLPYSGVSKKCRINDSVDLDQTAPSLIKVYTVYPGLSVPILRIFFGGVGPLRPVKIFSLILTQVNCKVGKNKRPPPEKKHLTTRQQNLACLMSPELG